MQGIAALAREQIRQAPVFSKGFWNKWFRHPDLEPFYRFGARILTHLIWRPTYIGFNKLPAHGAALLIANHVSYVDGVIIQGGCGRNVRFVIDGEIYKLPGVHYFMELNRAIPILPNRESVTNALEEIAAGLAAGDAICIFPEGQLTYTGSLGRFRPGIEWILKRTPVPVYPVALIGLWGSIFSRKYRKAKYRWIPQLFKNDIKAVMGDPIAPEQANVNALQQAILRLKYAALAEGR